MALQLNEEILSAIKTLQKYNFVESEHVLKREAGLVDNKCAEEFMKFKAEAKDNPESFGSKYQALLYFVDSVADNHKLELSSLLYPIFVHLYIRLISGNHYDEAKLFIDSFGKHQEDFYQSDIILLTNISDADQLMLNPLVESFKASEFTVSVASSSYALLKQYLHESGSYVMQSILNDQLKLQVLEGPPRTKLQLDCRRGALFGEAPREANREPVLYGLLNDLALTSIQSAIDSAQSCNTDTPSNPDPVEDVDADHTPVKKKKRRDGLGSTHPGAGTKDAQKSDSSSPAMDRIPLPKLRDTFIESRQALARETAALLRGVKKSTESETNIVLYTVCNVQAGESALSIRRGGVTCATFTDHAGWLAAGFGSGRIRIWSLGPESLRCMLPAKDLALLDKDDCRVRSKMLHDENDESHPTRDLLGHVGSVHGVAFSPDRQLVISGGSDGTVRLWSTMVWGGALTVWRDHLMPVWCVDWAPVYGYYIATGGADRSAHLYSTDHSPDALRVFVGHRADVTSVRIHPNVNYLATGSADRAVRLFDIRSGKMVRLFTGHKGSVQTLAFSPCGRYLASGGWCGAVCLWDLGSGNQVGQLGGYSAAPPSSSSSSADKSSWLTGPIVSLAYSPDAQSGVLASGGLDGVVRIWDTSNGRVVRSTPPSDSAEQQQQQQQPTGLIGMHRVNKQQIARSRPHSSTVQTNSSIHFYSPCVGPSVADQCLRESFYTRRTSVLGLQYVHPKLLLAVGPYNQN